MSKQSFGDESNWKHEPKTEHYVEDKFGKGSATRNWKKNIDETLESAANPAPEDNSISVEKNLNSKQRDEESKDKPFNKEKLNSDSVKKEIAENKNPPDDAEAISHAGKKRQDGRRYQ